MSDLRLSTRITVAALILVVFVGAITMLVENARIRDDSVSEWRSDLEGALDAEKMRLNQAINALRHDALFLSNTPPVSGIMRAALNRGYDARAGMSRERWEAQLRQLFSAFLSANPEYYQIRYIGVADGGREIVRVEDRGEKIEITPSAKLQQKADRDYFKETLALHEGQLYLSEFDLRQEHGVIDLPYMPTLRASVPVFSPAGQIFGIVIINMKAGKLMESATLGLPPGTQPYIANMDGQYLLRPDSQQAFTFELGNKDGLTTEFPFLKTMLNPQAADYLPMQTVATSTGGQYLAARRVHFDPDDPSRFLLLAYGIPGAVAAEQIPSIPVKHIVGGFIVMLLIGWITLLILRRTFAPLAQITAVANRIAAGEQIIRLPQAGSGEIGSLTNALNTMLDRLSQREHEILRINAGLEDRVRERTQELEWQITERKLAMLVLQESEHHLSRAQSIAHIGSWNYDMAACQLKWSDELYRIYGVSPETFTPNTEAFINLIHPDDQSAMRAWIIACASGQKPGALRFSCMWSDGTIRYIEGQGELIFDAEGKPGYMSGTAHDITERMKAEEQLRIAAATFETHEAIMITDTKANIIRVNRAFTDITGYSPEDVLGKNPRILSSGRQDKAFYATMWQQLLNTGSWSGEMWDRRKSGQIYPKWLTITAIKNEAGKTAEYVAMFSDITARKQAEEEIHNLAFYDALTKLPNRRLFLDRFCAALPVSARYNNYGAVLFIDLDRFKIVNDTLGHDYGDLLLIEVAARIKACVREMDTVARLGGDEFVVLIEDVSDDQDDASYKVGLVAEKIREALARPYNLNGHEHHSSPSIGVSLYRGNEETVEELLQHADMAMYQAKNSGRNAVRFFDPVMQNNVATRAALVNDLRSAIAVSGGA